MQHVSGKMAGVALVVSLVLVGGAQAQPQQEHQQHHPGGAQIAQQPPAATSAGAPAQPQQMQGMMERMQGMMERMQGMMGHGGMRGRQGMGRSAQEDDDEEDSPQRGMMGHRGMMGMGGMMGPGSMLGHHMERLTQQLQLTDQQQAQVRTLLRSHVKEAIRLRADVGMLAVDVRQVLDTDPVELPKVKQLLQNMAMKEADLRLAHITLMQEVNKLLTPEQQQKFRPMREGMMGMGGMMGHRGMMGRGHGER